MSTSSPRWVYEKEGKWTDYDTETTEELEEKINIVIKQKKNAKLNIVLNKGPFYGLDANKNKHKIVIALNAKSNPPIITRSVQTLNNKYVISKQMMNVTRFPCLDYFASKDNLYEIENYHCKHKWFYKHHQSEEKEDEEAEEWKEFDAITSKEIELCMNKEKASLILNKGEFASPKRKNLFKIRLNHHSIPPEATLIQTVNLKQENEIEVKYAAIELADDDDDDNDEQNGGNQSVNDEVMQMIMSTKHYMRPISIKYWQKQCDLSPNELPKCVICFEEFTKESFLEHWIMRKLQNKLLSKTGLYCLLCPCGMRV